MFSRIRQCCLVFMRGVYEINNGEPRSPLWAPWGFPNMTFPKICLDLVGRSIFDRCFLNVCMYANIQDHWTTYNIELINHEHERLVWVLNMTIEIFSLLGIQRGLD